MDPLTILTLVRGAIQIEELIRAAIRGGKGPVKPDGTPMTEADLDALRANVRATLADGIAAAKAELEKLG